MHKIIKNIKIDDMLMVLIGLLFPWSILFASPQLHIGYWGQVEGMIVFSHFFSAIVALLILKIGLFNKEIRQYFLHPLVLLPSLIGLYSVVSGLFQMLPILAFYGSPQLGQGAFGYFSLSLLTVLYLYLLKFNKLKPFFLINIILLTAVITIGSFYPVITGVVISFFGFNDWLALYFTALILFVLYFFEMKSIIINKEILGFILFLFLGPLFWKIDNNSSIALWVLISFSWLISIFISFCISLVTIKLSIKILDKTQTIDIPNKRSNHNVPTPKGAGIGLIASLLIMYYLFFPINDFIFTISIFLLCVMSFINDNKQISIALRLFIQTILAFIIISYWSPLVDTTLLTAPNKPSNTSL